MKYKEIISKMTLEEMRKCMAEDKVINNYS